MEYIKKEDLEDGDVFVSQMSRNHFLNKYGTGYSLHLNLDNTIKVQVLYRNGGLAYNNMRLATSEEKHWLNECIKLGKFITFEEAMKTFIPEYVEWIDNIGSGNLGYQTKDHFKKNKIFKTDVELPSHGFQTQSWIKHLEIYANNYKPSTKEAYDAQFVVKEPEFVVEEVIEKSTIENKTELEIWLENTKSLNLSLEDLEKYIGSSQTCNFINIYMKLEGNHSKDRAKILFDKWNEKVIEPLPQFKVIESIETITKVENNEGNQFFIGDVVKSSNGTVQTIESFDYNTKKTNIIAFTNKQSILGNGIGIDEIEHYIEPKTDYKILEYKTEGGISCKAPFLADSHQFYINERCKIYSIKRISDDLIITVGDEVLSKTCGVPNKILSIELINNKIRLYPRNSFYNLEDIIKVKEETLLEKAKIIEHSHDFKIGDKIKIKSGSREFNFVYKIIKIEGNVLFFGNSIHSRVLAKNVIKVN